MAPKGDKRELRRTRWLFRLSSPTSRELHVRSFSSFLTPSQRVALFLQDVWAFIAPDGPVSCQALKYLFIGYNHKNLRDGDQRSIDVYFELEDGAIRASQLITWFPRAIISDTDPEDIINHHIAMGSFRERGWDTFVYFIWVFEFSYFLSGTPPNCCRARQDDLAAWICTKEIFNCAVFLNYAGLLNYVLA